MEPESKDIILLVQKKIYLKPNCLMNLNISVNCLAEKIGKQNETSCMKKVGISESETKNPSERKNVGKSTNKKSIPNEVLIKSGKVNHEQSDILKHWRDTFFGNI